MEKLIKLLNEREKTVNGIQNPGRCKEHLEYQCHGPRVINKRFGFIKWLVKEDKINLGKIKKLYRKSNEHSTHTYPILYDYSYDESLLMLLAIQDEPIDFLISILK